MKESVFTLRVSVLENCQLRCSYCLPNTVGSVFSKNSWLSPHQYEIIAQSFACLAISKIRFTGGEPLLRKDLAAIIHAFSHHVTKAKLALTTNGLAYEKQSLQLKNAGLNSITFHLDTLSETRFKKIMGKGDVACVLSAIEAAKALVPMLKINVVVQKGLNDDEIPDFIAFGQEQNIEVRFIELMNTGSAGPFVARHFMSGAEILQVIAQRFAIEPVEREDQASPAERFFIRDLDYCFGLIASDTRPFCHNCNRLRLSADGILRTCLYESEGVHLGFSKQSSPSVRDLLDRITQKIANKTSFHPNLNQKRRIFSMSQTGG